MFEDTRIRRNLKLSWQLCLFKAKKKDAGDFSLISIKSHPGCQNTESSDVVCQKKKTRTWLNFCWKPMQRHPGLPVKHRQGGIPGGLLCKTTVVMWQFRKELCNFMTFRESCWKSCHSISVDETVYIFSGTSHEGHNWTIDTGTWDYNLWYHHNHFNTALWLFIKQSNYSLNRWAPLPRPRPARARTTPGPKQTRSSLTLTCISSDVSPVH